MPAPNRWQQLITTIVGGRLGFNPDKRLVSEGAVVAVETRDESGNVTGLSESTTAALIAFPKNAVVDGDHIPALVEAQWLDIGDGWLNQQTAAERYIAAGDGVPYQMQFVDYENGNDANSGATELLPKKKITAATKLATYTVLLKRGVTHIYDDAVNPYAVPSGHHVGAYGDLSDPKPIIRSTSAASQVFAVQGSRSSLSISDIDIDLDGLVNRRAVSVESSGAGQTLTDMQFRNLRAFNGTASGYTPAFIVQGPDTTSQTSNTTEIYDILFENCTADHTPGHGFHVYGAIGKLVSSVWHGVDFYGCLADGCGSDYDNHGFSTYSAGAFSGTPAVGNWTSAGGNVYYLALNAATVYNRNVWGITHLIIQLNSGAWVVMLENTSTPTTPAAWEYGVDTGTQRMYVNLNGESLTAAAHQLRMAVQAVRGVRWIHCTAQGQEYPNTTGIQEGHGFAFDDLVSECSMLYCVSRDNAGYGLSINNGTNNTVRGNRIINNTYGQIGNGLNIGNKVGHNLIMQSSTSPAGMINTSNASTAPGFTGVNGMTVYRNAFIYTGTGSANYAMSGGAAGNQKRILARNNFYSGCNPCLSTAGVTVQGALTDLRKTFTPMAWTDF